MRNALKQTVLLWTLLLLLTTWLGFFAVSAVVKYAVVVILVAVTAAVMAYWHKKRTGRSGRRMAVIATAGNLPTAGSAGLWRYVGAPVH